MQYLKHYIIISIGILTATVEFELTSYTISPYRKCSPSNE